MKSSSCERWSKSALLRCPQEGPASVAERVSRAPRRACDRDTAAEAGWRAHDRGCAGPDHGRRLEGLVLTF
jgi:hypothetical protein